MFGNSPAKGGSTPRPKVMTGKMLRIDLVQLPERWGLHSPARLRSLSGEVMVGVSNGCLYWDDVGEAPVYKSSQQNVASTPAVLK